MKWISKVTVVLVIIKIGERYTKNYELNSSKVPPEKKIIQIINPPLELRNKSTSCLKVKVRWMS